MSDLVLHKEFACVTNKHVGNYAGAYKLRWTGMGSQAAAASMHRPGSNP